MSWYDDMWWHEFHFWSLHEKSHKSLITLVCWYLVSYKYMCPFTSRNIGQISYILCQLLVCSGKSQLSNYANANYLKISIWTWLMSYHVKTTLCHDITTYDISWQPYSLVWCFSMKVLLFSFFHWPRIERIQDMIYFTLDKDTTYYIPLGQVILLCKLFSCKIYIQSSYSEWCQWLTLLLYKIL